MSNFAKSHSLPTFKERVASKKEKGIKEMGKWYRADRVVDEVYDDLIKGALRSDVMKKLKDGAYNNQERGINDRTAGDYVNAAMERLQFDYEKNAEQIRADLYSKMMAVYAECMKKNDRFNAIVALDKIMKLTGVANDRPQTAIQINGDKDNGIVVNFGFDKNDDKK